MIRQLAEYENRVLWSMADNDFSKANPILSKLYAGAGVFLVLFCLPADNQSLITQTNNLKRTGVCFKLYNN